MVQSNRSNTQYLKYLGSGAAESVSSDILGLLGNTPRYKSFSFLTGDKFRSPKNNKSKQFMNFAHKK